MHNNKINLRKKIIIKATLTRMMQLQFIHIKIRQIILLNLHKYKISVNKRVHKIKMKLQFIHSYPTITHVIMKISIMMKLLKR